MVVVWLQLAWRMVLTLAFVEEAGAWLQLDFHALWFWGQLDYSREWVLGFWFSEGVAVAPVAQWVVVESAQH